MPKNDANIIRCGFDDFCSKHNMTKADLARGLEVDRQQITNWINAPLSNYFIEHNVKTNRVNIIRGEKLVGQYKMTKATA